MFLIKNYLKNDLKNNRNDENGRDNSNISRVFDYILIYVYKLTILGLKGFLKGF